MLKKIARDQQKSAYARWFGLVGLTVCAILLMACNQPTYQTQGYIEGRFTYITTNVAGTLQKIFVVRGERITLGKPLFALEQEPEKSAFIAAQEQVAAATAQQSQAQARRDLARLTLQRYQNLYRHGSIDKASVDSSQTDYNTSVAALKTAQANLAAANAALTQANWTIAQKAVTAPITGLVFDTYFQPGELVSVGQPVVALLDPHNIKAIFFVGEKQLGRLQLGQTVQLHCDQCRHRYTAKINFIAPVAEYTPPVIYSNETTEKLVYRIEAAIAQAAALTQLRPGQPVQVRIEAQ